MAVGLVAVFCALELGLSSQAFAVSPFNMDSNGQPAQKTSAESTRPDPSILSHPDRLWALRRIDLPAGWTARSSPDVIVAILDTGIDSQHEELAGKVSAEVNFTDSPTVGDINGHGTRIAGIIAGSGNNSLGIAGVAPNARLLNVKVADDFGVCNAEAVARGILWAVDHGANVINISLEVRDPSTALENAVDYAWSHGTVIVAAAGNDAGSTPVYPAYYSVAISVAATGPDDELAPLSNHGDWVDMAAPGLNIYSTTPGNGYGYESGTSFAAAYVSGLAALAFGAVTDEDSDGRLNDEVRTAIENSCDRIAASGVGHGRVDAARLLQARQ